jgi:hypothetical protein
MASKKWTVLVVLMLVALLSIPLVAAAQPQLQGPEEQEQPDEPADALAIEGDLASSFYYQGILTENGSPVQGNRSMEFKLFTAASGGTQVGSTITLTVPVIQGQFNVALTAWGASQIDGRALWLAVRAKDASSVWRSLGRTQIRAVPYAMSLLPGARVVKNSSGADVLYLESKGTDYALRAIANHGSYDGVWATGGDDGLYGETTGTGSSNVGVVGLAVASTGSARGGDFYSKSGIGVYAQSDKVQAVYATSDNHDGVAGYSKAAGRSGVYGYSEVANGVFGRSNNVDGYGVFGQNNQIGVATAGFMAGYSPSQKPSTWWDPAALFGGRNGVVGFTKDTTGVGVVAQCTATSGSGCRGIHAISNSPTGWAGKFEGNGNGIYVTVPAGKKGLQVASGTKSAVVGTSDGSRLLYTEESTEVWFTDYGFGTLLEGVAVVTIDPIFAQTVNLAEPYHVFVQAYGPAEMYVTNRTPTSFEVHLLDGDASAEFSYRLVASRRGYEADRLERAPEADSDPNLYPERAAELQALAEQNNGLVPQ